MLFSWVGGAVIIFIGTRILKKRKIIMEYKEGEMTRGEFTKSALKKLGKSFLGLFVNTVS